VIETTAITPSPICSNRACRKQLNRATSAEGEHRPQAWDITVCAYCGQVMQFTQALELQVLPLDRAREMLTASQVKLVERLQKAFQAGARGRA
jgi:hypothetical protein